MRLRYLYQSRSYAFMQTRDLLPSAGARAALRPLFVLSRLVLSRGVWTFFGLTQKRDMVKWVHRWNHQILTRHGVTRCKYKMGTFTGLNTLRSVQKWTITIMVHHNLGTAVRYLSQLATPQLRHNIVIFSIITKIGYGAYLVLLNLGTIIKSQ